VWPQLWVLIGSSYIFKMVTALLDTIPFYLGCHWMRRYLGLMDLTSLTVVDQVDAAGLDR
jgi:uncharacterized PurR-regulated membrane protein YhhQ (DUF165 family)